MNTGKPTTSVLSVLSVSLWLVLLSIFDHRDTDSTEKSLESEA
jgi:hypothetical protein